MNQQTPKPTPATMPKRAQPVTMGPDYTSKRDRKQGAKRDRKQTVRQLRDSRDDNIARSSAPPRVLSQRIGDLFPELKSL